MLVGDWAVAEIQKHSWRPQGHRILPMIVSCGHHIAPSLPRPILLNDFVLPRHFRLSASQPGVWSARQQGVELLLGHYRRLHADNSCSISHIKPQTRRRGSNVRGEKTKLIMCPFHPVQTSNRCKALSCLCFVLQCSSRTGMMMPLARPRQLMTTSGESNSRSPKLADAALHLRQLETSAW